MKIKSALLLLLILFSGISQSANKEKYNKIIHEQNAPNDSVFHKQKIKLVHSIEFEKQRSNKNYPNCGNFNGFVV